MPPDIEKPKLYVGCGLTNAPREFTDRVDLLKAKLREEDWDVMEFLGTVAGTAEDVYQRDIVENVGGCDAFVGIFDEPSTGLGFELNESLRLGKPTLGVAHVDTRVTRLVLGAASYHENFNFWLYEDMVEDVPAIVAEEFSVVYHALARVTHGD